MAIVSIASFLSPLPCARFEWEQTNLLLGHSVATISWTIPEGVTPGTYRIQHFGYHKPLDCKQLTPTDGLMGAYYFPPPFSADPKPYNGTSSNFKVSQ